MKNIINIYYSSFTEQLPEEVFEKYLSLLPTDLKTRNKLFIRWQDRYLHLLGKLLLIKAFNEYGLSREILNQLKYNKNNRPFLKNVNIDFNISHSGNYAICAISNNSKVGVDIEEIKIIEFADFQKVFTKREWAEIEKSKDCFLKFYSFWTRKESLIKADGRGLSIPLDCIDVVDDSIYFDNQMWYLKKIKINETYCTSIASNKHDICIKMTELKLKPIDNM